ncbi:MAG: DUF4358 domain-containing protein [Lachnospiraceae bacterium]|nr:DUF4358 domain-containing protein [Lachnospiraceae bacterium]
MALIKCPECGKEISDQAANCPNCGFPVNKSDSQSVPTTQSHEEIIEKAKHNKRKLKKGLIAIGAVLLIAVILIIALSMRKEWLTAQEMAVKVGYNAVKERLLNPDSMIVYSCYAHETQSEQLMSEEYAKRQESESDYVKEYDLIDVYFYIGAQNKTGGIAEEEYIVTCNMNGTLLNLSSKSAYEDTDVSDRSHQTAGSWLEVEYAQSMSPSWKGWDKYSDEDLKRIINSTATRVSGRKTKSQLSSQSEESDGAPFVLDMEELAYDLMDACDGYLNSGSEEIFKEKYSLSDIKEFFTFVTGLASNPNEVTVILCNNEDAVDQTVASFEKYIEKEIQLYKHTSSEIDKLENAIIKTKGLYAILCVCDDYSKANTILQEYGFD